MILGSCWLTLSSRETSVSPESAMLVAEHRVVCHPLCLAQTKVSYPCPRREPKSRTTTEGSWIPWNSGSWRHPPWSCPPQSLGPCPQKALGPQPQRTPRINIHHTPKRTKQRTPLQLTSSLVDPPRPKEHPQESPPHGRWWCQSNAERWRRDQSDQRPNPPWPERPRRRECVSP
jgi:hypothetical protein